MEAADELATHELTIDELASRAGMTVRNVRAHQSRGLLPPPRIVGRTGYYGPEHVRRLDRIRELQDEGLNLAAISRILGEDELTAVATGPFRDAVPELRPAADLAARLRIEPDDPGIERSVELGLVTVKGEQVRVELPRLLAVAEELADEGVPLAAMLDVVAEVQAAAARVARAFMTLADEHLVSQVVLDTGGDLAGITAKVERLQGQASTALDALFNQAMAEQIRAYLASPADPPPGTSSAG